jgi:hypothetical protein
LSEAGIKATMETMKQIGPGLNLAVLAWLGAV